MGFFGFTLSYIAFAIAHIAQFALAIAVCGLYGQDLHAAQKQGAYMDSKWVYAVVVGSLSAFTAVLYLVPMILRYSHFTSAWGFVLFIMWIVLFGIFGKMYIHEDPEGNSGIQRMKNAVWVDLANALLWFFTSVAGLVYWHTHRERHTRFTSRATV